MSMATTGQPGISLCGIPSKYFSCCQAGKHELNSRFAAAHSSSVSASEKTQWPSDTLLPNVLTNISQSNKKNGGSFQFYNYLGYENYVYKRSMILIYFDFILRG